MANEKISDMPAADTLTGAELLPLVQSGSNVQSTAQDVANLGGGGGSVNGLSDGATNYSDNNLFIGQNAKTILDGVTGAYNIGVGYVYAVLGAGEENTAFGTDCLNANTTGSANVAIGVGALPANISGSGNLAIGGFALGTNESGNQNIAIGDSALAGSTGDRNLGLGPNADVAMGVNNAISIGFNAVSTKSFSAQIGSSDIKELYVGTSASNVSLWKKVKTLTFTDFANGTLSGGDLVSTISAAYTTAADSLFSAVQIRVTEAFDAPTIATCALDASSFNAALTAVNMVPVAKTTNTTPETALKSGALSVAATAAGDTWPDFTAGSLDIWVLLSAVPA